MNNPKLDSDLDRVMQLVAERAQLMTSATGAAVEIAEGDKMVYRAASGSVSSFYGLKLDITSSLSGKCVQHR